MDRELKIKKVTDYLDSLNINYQLIRHKEVITTEQSKEVIKVDNCCSCKSLYVKDKKSDNYYLIVLQADKRADMRGLASYVGVNKFEFATEERLFRDLGVHRGSVSPFAFLNESGNKIPMLIDKDILNSQRVKFHPCDNTATVVLNVSDFVVFINSLDKSMVVV